MSTYATPVAFTVGRHTITPLLDGHGHEPARDVLTNPERGDDPWSGHEELLDIHGNLPLEVGGHLIRTREGRVVVVDTGVGTIDNGKYLGGQFLESLREQGLEPEDVTDVLLTHLHFDHVGWSTKKGAVVFPRATYHVHQRDWDHFVASVSAEAGAVRKLSPLEPHLELFTAEQTLMQGIDARPVPGHTPGSTSFVVSEGQERAVLIGDMAHAYIELSEPGWNYVHDVLPQESIQARSALVDEFADTGTAIIGAHFPGMRAGLLSRHDGQTAWSWT